MCRGFPRLECFEPMVADGESGTAASSDREKIASCGLHGDEALQSTRRSEALHYSLSFSERQMAVFSAVVEPLVGPMIKAESHLTFGGTIGAKFVRNDPFGNKAPAFHQLDQKPLCGALVSARLQDFLKNNAVLVDRAPEPV